MGRHKGRAAAALMLAFFAAALAGGCQGRSNEAVNETVNQTVNETVNAEEGSFGRAEEEKSTPGAGAEKINGTESTDGGESGGAGAEEIKGTAESGQAAEEAGPAVQQKIVIASDLHYLAEELSGNRGESFMSAVEESDGRVLQYGWEILDAFLYDMLKEKPDLVLLSGDLTFNGEKESHEELAEKLSVLPENGIPVIVIPGNHDINNPAARKFTSAGAERTDSITAAEFEEIYAGYGYRAASERDPDSLSYVYELDDYYRLLMLDTCQYDPFNRIGGMLSRETYDWIDARLEEAWEDGAQFITVSHHNLLDQSGVSRDFYDDCTIEHNEELIQRLSDWQVRLHLSGHLHLQHHMKDEDSGVSEVVTGSLVMAPCHYGVLKIMDSGELVYDAQSVDVSGWASRNSYRNKALTDFETYSREFLYSVTYQNARKDLRKHTADRKLFLSDERIDEMAEFYARLCVYYYGGNMFEIADQMEEEPAFRYWTDVDYISDLSDFLRNILNDDAKDFSHLTVPY